MPHSVNGFGTGLVRISRVRTDAGAGQCDAMEAVIALGLPTIPYKVLHIVNHNHTDYTGFALRWTAATALRVLEVTNATPPTFHQLQKRRLS